MLPDPPEPRRGSRPDLARWVAVLLAATLGAALPVACSGDSDRIVRRPPLVTAPTPTEPTDRDQPATTPTVPTSPTPPVTVLAAGDIAVCGDRGAVDTATLLDGLEGSVLTLGDHVYRSGTHREFSECYDPSWGRHRARTYPAPGNHDYETPGAQGYFTYFGARAGNPGVGYYTVTLGAWRLYSLNSEIPAGPGSPQYTWLQQELTTSTPPVARAHEDASAGDVGSPAAAPRATTTPSCTLAYWHKPVVSSGKHGNNSHMLAIWQLLHENGADVVLAAHDHTYERFLPLDGRLRLDPERGLRAFVVGTGGAPVYGFPNLHPQSAVRAAAHGVLQLVLKADGYDWSFIPAAGHSLSDVGSGVCH